MNNADRKQLRRLVDQAGKTKASTFFANVGGWRFGLSCGLLLPGGSAPSPWHLTASLYPMGRSSVEADWRFLGEATAVLGVPEGALLTPLSEQSPNAVHRWQWGGTSESQEVTREVLAAARPLWGQYGPCQAHETCVVPSVCALACVFCEKQYAYCEGHTYMARTLMRGHVLRVHPEELPREEFHEILKDREVMAALRQQRALAPDLWAHFFECAAKAQSN